MERIEQLENDMRVVATMLANYIKTGMETGKKINDMTDELDKVKTDNLRMQGIINDQHNRIEQLEHDLYNEIQLHDWMTEESHQHAIDYRITPHEITRGIKNRDDAILRFGRNRH